MASSIALSFSSFRGLGYESVTFPAWLPDAIVKRLRSSKLGCPPNYCADPASFATFRVLLLVAGSPSCNAIKSDLSLGDVIGCSRRLWPSAACLSREFIADFLPSMRLQIAFSVPSFQSSTDRLTNCIFSSLCLYQFWYESMNRVF